MDPTATEQSQSWVEGTVGTAATGATNGGGAVSGGGLKLAAAELELPDPAGPGGSTGCGASPVPPELAEDTAALFTLTALVYSLFSVRILVLLIRRK